METKVVFFCQVRRAIRMYPYMADLPGCRVAYNEPPFTNCGCDPFGPVYIKQGRKRLKRWGVIFTCLTVRCIHLEIVESCETDSFINAFRRFTNRRGCPKTVYSDCGSNLTGAVNELGSERARRVQVIPEERRHQQNCSRNEDHVGVQSTCRSTYGRSLGTFDPVS